MQKEINKTIRIVPAYENKTIWSDQDQKLRCTVKLYPSRVVVKPLTVINTFIDYYKFDESSKNTKQL